MPMIEANPAAPAAPVDEHVWKVVSVVDGAAHLHQRRLMAALRWTGRRHVLVRDLFRPEVPQDMIAAVFEVMASTREHTFEVLVDAPARARQLLTARVGVRNLADMPGPWPLANVWLGLAVDGQPQTDSIVPLLETPAAVRFIRAAPLRGPLDLRTVRYAPGSNVLDVLYQRYRPPSTQASDGRPCTPFHLGMGSLGGIHWVIVGGDTARDAQPLHPAWVRKVRDDCAGAGVPFRFLGWGEHLPVPIEDDPRMAGGRAFTNPRRGGRCAALIRERSPGPFRSGETRPLRAGDTNGYGRMLDDDTIAVRVGRSRSGRDLDGRTWDQYPDRKDLR